MPMTVNYFIQARMSSTRFPGKVLASVKSDKTLLDYILERIKKTGAGCKNTIVLLTTESKADDVLVDYAKAKDIVYYRGSEWNVFQRFQDACIRFPCDFFFRICADNPFLESDFLNRLSKAAEQNYQYDYFSYKDKLGTPAIKTHYGFFAELLKVQTFLNLSPENLTHYEMEHVTPHLYLHPELFQCYWIEMPAWIEDGSVRLSVDTLEDLMTIRQLIKDLPESFQLKDVYDLLKISPYLKKRMFNQIRGNQK